MARPDEGLNVHSPGAAHPQPGRRVLDGKRQSVLARSRADIRAAGHQVGEKRVARLMRSAGLKGVSPRKFTTTTTPSDAEKKSPDLVKRDSRATAPPDAHVPGSCRLEPERLRVTLTNLSGPA